MDDLIDALVVHGPAVLGLEWREDMYDAPGGELRGTGPAVGGHCILAVGYDPARRFSDGTVTGAIALFNSWGRSWDVNGVAWIKVFELAPLLANDGEACIPVRRSYGRRPSTVVKALAAVSRLQ